MTRIAILIAGLITSGTAFAQPLTPPPELLSQETPEWFASARAFVPPDRVAGEKVQTQKTGCGEAACRCEQFVTDTDKT